MNAPELLGPGLIVLTLHLVVLVAVLSELAPRTLTLWKLRRYGDGYGVDRIRTWIKSTGIVLVSGFESLLWIDYVFFGQHWLGRFTERWLVDVLVWGVLAIGAVQVARLYWNLEHRKERRDLEDARMGGKMEPDPS